MENSPKKEFNNEIFAYSREEEWGPIVYPYLLDSDPLKNAMLAQIITNFLYFRNDKEFVESLKSSDIGAVESIEGHKEVIEAIKKGTISKAAPWFEELKDRMGRFGIYLASVGGVRDLEKGKRETEEINKMFDAVDEKFNKSESRLNQPKKRLEDWQNITIDDLRRIIERGERIEVKVQRSSGEMDDDWEIFDIGSNEKIVVKKFVKGKVGTKNIPFIILKSWNQ